MTLIEDADLLRRYAEQGDEGAFAELVRRRVDRDGMEASVDRRFRRWRG